MANVAPIGDKILIKRLDAEEVTRGGIILPDTAKEKPREGRVLRLGEGRLLEDGSRAPFQVKIDDRVIFTSYAGTEIKIDGEELMILGEEDILAIID